jgi:hypothetical protein
MDPACASPHFQESGIDEQFTNPKQYGVQLVTIYNYRLLR